MYTFLLLLTLRNIRQILVKQREYKNLPLLLFYAFSLIAISLRIISLECGWLIGPISNNVGVVQQAAKLSVGAVQDWITIELAIRIHNSNGYSDISESVMKKLRVARKIFFALLTLTFVAFSITTLVSALKPKN